MFGVFDEFLGLRWGLGGAQWLNEQGIIVQGLDIGSDLACSGDSIVVRYEHLVADADIGSHSRR
jgi:hypothetical protein